MSLMEKKIIYAVFDDEEKVVLALNSLKENHLEVNDVYGPFADHDILKKATRPSPIPNMGFVYGMMTIVGAFGFIYWTSVINYPLVYGGKPIFSFPPMVVLLFLITILGTSTLSVFTFLGITFTFPGKKAHLPHPAVNDDHFVVETAALEDTETAKRLFTENGALECREETIS